MELTNEGEDKVVGGIPSTTLRIEDILKANRLATLEEVEREIKEKFGSYNDGCSCCSFSRVDEELPEFFAKLKNQ